MELDPKDYDIVKLLTRLKKTDETYPSDMLASRRQKYIRRVAEIGVGLGVSAGLRSTIKSGKSGAFTSTASGLLEAALMVAIVVEASAAAYFYRDKIAQIIQSYSSTTQDQEVTSPPEFFSPLPEFPSPLPEFYSPPPEFKATEIPEIRETRAPSETPTGTPILVESTNINNSSNGNNSNNQAFSTPNPNGNNGNHFGQTPKPERTKDNGDNAGGNNGDGNGGGNTNKKDK